MSDKPKRTISEIFALSDPVVQKLLAEKQATIDKLNKVEKSLRGMLKPHYADWRIEEALAELKEGE